MPDYVSVNNISFRSYVIEEGQSNWHTVFKNPGCEILIGEERCAIGNVKLNLIREYDEDGKHITTTLYYHLPAMNLNCDELHAFRQFGRSLCYEVVELLDAQGWKLGKPLLAWDIAPLIDVGGML